MKHVDWFVVLVAALLAYFAWESHSRRICRASCARDRNVEACVEICR